MYSISQVICIVFFFRELTNSKEEIAYLKRALKEQVIMHDILIDLHTALLEKLNYTFFFKQKCKTFSDTHDLAEFLHQKC